MTIIVLTIILFVIVFYLLKRSNFKRTIITPISQLDPGQPKEFPPIDQKHSDFPPLAPPVVPEEIGLAMVYPQGVGVSMSKQDSNSFAPGDRNGLLTDYRVPQAYGESNLVDTLGVAGANQGSRIIKIQSTGTQANFKPVDETKDSDTFINGAQPINYSDNFNPEQNLKLQSSPGQVSSIPNCETTYPNTVKYGDYCITEGDIPYGETVNGKVNPRLVSRWQSFTGDYSRQEALSPIDGTLYPNLTVLAN